jgi:hypothetical protein
MRILDVTSDESVSDSPVPRSTALVKSIREHYASFCSYKQLTTNYIQIIYISGSRTPATHELCATASARRLCEY